MKIKIQSSLGVITSDELINNSMQEVWDLVRNAASGELTHMRFKVKDMWTYIPSNVLINSVITIIE